MTDRLLNVIKAHASNLDRSTGQIKFGTVVSVDFRNGTARVLFQPDGTLSGWLPVLSQWVGNGWGMVCPTSPGDQVVVVPQEGDIEQGIIIGRSYSSKQKPPTAPVGEFWLVHQSGSFLQLRNDGTIRVNGDMHVQGDVYDQHGSLAALRTHYNSHVHPLSPNTVTGKPVPLDE
jgi:phage baseplate assembly protein V